MEEQIQKWHEKYMLDKLIISGYEGGYPIIQFENNNYVKEKLLKVKDINKIVRKAEMSAGMEMGVGLNFRRTAFINVNTENVIICGHELILEKILVRLFDKN